MVSVLVSAVSVAVAAWAFKPAAEPLRIAAIAYESFVYEFMLPIPLRLIRLRAIRGLRADFSKSPENSIAAEERKPYFVVDKHRGMLNFDPAMRKFDVRLDNSLTQECSGPSREGKPGARNGVPTASSSSLTIIDDHAPPP